MTRRKSVGFREIAERRFKHKVDIEVPDHGLGQRLTEMIDWCRATEKADDWAHHSYREKLEPGRVPRDYARFYFEDRAIATSFANAWAGKLQDD